MTQGVRRVFSRRTQRDAAQRAASKAAQSFRDDVRNREEAKVRKLREEKPEPQELERRTATAEADSFEEIAKERKLAVKESPFLQEGEPLAELDLPDARAFLVELHRKGPDKLRLAIGNRAAYCLRLGESAPPTGKDFEEKKEGIRQDLERRKMLGFLRAQQEILWEAARVEDFAEKTKTGASPEPDHPR